MRITTFLLLVCVFCSFAENTHSQNARVSISQRNTSLDKILNEIENQTDYLFIYNNEINITQEVSLKVKNKPVSEVLTDLLSGRGVDFQMEGTHIVLSRRGTSAVSTTAQQQSRIVKGTVVDTNGEPIIGANIMVKGTTTGTISDIDGNFSLSVNDKDILHVSYIGFQQVEVKPVNNMTISMKEDIRNLDEIVVVGYGTMQKKDLTGSVSSLKTEQLQVDQPETVQDMLRTGVAGLSVGISNDTKGNTSLLVRGKKSIKAGTSPLVVLDGVIYPGEITDINPNDIEQIDILKDASSAAVYGAKSASGVVLITTKKGYGKKPNINFSSTLGMSMKNSIPKVYDGAGYLSYKQAIMESTYAEAKKGQYTNPNNLPEGVSLEEWMAYTGAKGDPVNEWLRRLNFTEIETSNYLVGNTIDWENEVYDDVALRQDYSISISGKKDEVAYYSSLNYLKNENNVKGGGYDAVRGRINLESKALNIITYGVNAQFTSRNEGYTSVSTGFDNQSPYGSIYDEDGKMKIYPHDDNNATNPLIDAYYTDKKYTIRNLNASLYLKVDLPFGFSVQSTYSPRFEWIKELVHQSSEHPEWAKKGGYAKRRHKEDQYWQWDNMLKWNKTFGKSVFDLTLLANWEKFQNWESTMENDNFEPSDILGYGYIKAGLNPIINSYDEYRTGDAYMGRLHYSFDKKYIFTTTLRRDGFSAFGQKNPRATFPSAALGWVFSEEKFFPSNSWFEYGKIRLSWGKNGNRDIGVYQALMDMASRKYLYASESTGEVYSVNAYYANRMANANLKWETTESLNGGLDFSLFRGRLGGSLDIYKMNTTDLLNSRKLPNIIGYASVMANIGEVQNTGFEVSLNSLNLETENMTWRTTFNIAYNKNRILHLYGDMVDVLDANGNVVGQKEADDISNKWFIGHSLDDIWGYKVIGVWQENEVDEAKKYGLVPGDFKISDIDGNYKFTNEDKVFQGTTTPKVRWNMRNEFVINKKLTVSFSLYSYLGHKGTYNIVKHTSGVITRMNSYDVPYWTPNNPTNEYARLNSSSGGLSYDVYRNKSFVRLDNVSVSYSFPKKLISPWKISELRTSLSMKNVCFIAPDWKFGDPENSGNNTPRIIYFGLNITL